MSPRDETKLLRHINRRKWWHVPPLDPHAYKKRGIFYSSSFAEAEFWGRPLDRPDKVCVQRLLAGDEQNVHRKLFGKAVPYPGDDVKDIIRWRHTLDARMKRAALARGYDAIAILTPREFHRYRRKGTLPRSVELNVLVPNMATRDVHDALGQ